MVRLLNLNTKLIDKEDTNEFWAVREIILDTGRVIGYLLLMVVGMFGAEYLKVLLLFTSLLIVVLGYIITKIDKYE